MYRNELLSNAFISLVYLIYYVANVKKTKTTFDRDQQWDNVTPVHPLQILLQ
jgi:hypothetical protein